MTGFLIQPLTLDFRGIDADEHVVDALLLGRSLGGLAKIYNSAGQVYFFGPEDRAPRLIRTCVGPPREGSVTYAVYLLLVHGQLPLYPEALGKFADFAIPRFVKAIIAKRVGQNQMSEKLIEQIAKQQQDNIDLLKAAQERGFATEQRLFDLVEGLTFQNRRSLSDFASPIGKTVRVIRQTSAESEDIEIDPATADALRSKSNLKVGEIITVIGTLSKIDKKTGSCRIQTSETKQEINAKIVDPVLQTEANIYTEALHSGRPIVATGKPTTQDDGSISKLFISDTRFAD
ncbi:MAG: hypothetical protein Q8M31_05870 [Beijerinckiaceae bacterium]|nr:hypothetical protein [Beijerinckiaceae bacterium]